LFFAVRDVLAVRGLSQADVPTVALLVAAAGEQLIPFERDKNYHRTI
jgi:hypothetical protein